ncbi:MBL fold metallo-hydrolase [Haladaptatus halobius]|uniref:MBL fold metallo-hydrolase n=1 Tax=Haladaptatus halobius TaxID=2884875 RepID=UPI001D0A778E|nr:MBL fold metallo-hydrolase [Haladaptatus halobius]
MRLTDSIALVGSGDARLTDPYDCNIYAIKSQEGALLIDTGGGGDTELILENARHTFGDVVGALITHAHADHAQGGPELQDRDIPVVAPTPSVPLLTEGTETELGITAAKRDSVYPDDYEYSHYTPDQTATPGSILELGGRQFDIVQIRGHASDHVAYLTEVDGLTACFIGDAVYPDGSISLLNTPGSSLAAYRTDIENLVGRGIDALFTGHGLPRLRDGQDSIDQAADALAGMYTPPSRT